MQELYEMGAGLPVRVAPKHTANGKYTKNSWYTHSQILLSYAALQFPYSHSNGVIALSWRKIAGVVLISILLRQSEFFLSKAPAHFRAQAFRVPIWLTRCRGSLRELDQRTFKFTILFLPIRQFLL